MRFFHCFMVSGDKGFLKFVKILLSSSRMGVEVMSWNFP